MCGIAGLLDPSRGFEELGSLVREMGDTLIHRGPDSSGTWADAGIGLVHRRLAIIDLTPSGHQPMISSSGRYVLAFNGEIYNFRDLRQRLEKEGAGFRGQSDTEVLLAAIESWGVHQALEATVGMFAFGLWDREARTLTLARDRLGEKPLYWATDGRRFAFASELRALRRVEGLCGSVCPDSILLFLRYNYIPSPHSVFSRVRKLTPGSLLTVRLTDRCLIEESEYWSVSGAYEKASRKPFTGDFQEAVNTLEDLLRRAIRGQMVSDVPVGAFLSGGIDSSAVASLMQAESASPIRTFTIGFREDGFNESDVAEEVAKQIGTDHLTMYVTAQDALKVVSKLPRIYDEPFADSSQIPTYLLSALTRQHVTVALSGDGGDELFGGYNRYLWAQPLWRGLALIPRPLRRLVASLSRGVSPMQVDRFLMPAMRFLPRKLQMPHVGERFIKLASALDVREASEAYRRFLSHWDDPAVVALHGSEPSTAASNPVAVSTVDEFVRYMMMMDSRYYLPDDIMVKVDRASMAVSLEGRIPFLDHRVFEFAASLPVEFLIEGRRGKRVLREILYRHVPGSIVDRPKKGFAVPLEDWLRGPLREWASDLLSPATLRKHGVFRPEVVGMYWRDHLSGRRAWHYRLWDVLMLTAWLDDNELSLS
jgi:asparagine synthase (glutamine-hydrolysing)